MSKQRVLAGRSAIARMDGGSFSWAWRLYLLAGVLAAGGYYLLPSAAAQNAFVVLVDLSVVGAIAAGILAHRPSHPLPWHLFAFGTALSVLGDVFWAIHFSYGEDPSASVADALYVGSVPFFVAGLLLIGRGGAVRKRANLIDSLIVATGAGMLSWVLLLDPGASVPALSLLERLLSVAYLFVYVVLIAIVVRPLFVAKKRTPALYLLCGALAILVMGDLAFGSLTEGTFEAYGTGGLVYSGYLLSSALFGAAALHPSMARLSEPTAEAQATLTAWRLLLLTGAMLTAPSVLAIQAALGQPIAVVLVVVGSAVMFSLVAVRMAGMIEEGKRAEREVREANRRLKELAVLKADFTSMVAHELGGPLAAVRRLAEMLSAGGSDPEIREYVTAAIEGEMDALDTLVSDVRASAEVERDDFRVQPRLVALGELLADAEDFSRALPQDRPVELVLDPRLARRERVLADQERIGQVLRNLLGNAAKYSPQGVPIELRVKREHEDRVRIEVADHGPGIRPEDRVRIFEKFGRGRDREGKKISGAGLGLYLSRGIARAHGSELTVYSTPGEGAVFGFDLRVAR